MRGLGLTHGTGSRCAVAAGIDSRAAMCVVVLESRCAAGLILCARLRRPVTADMPDNYNPPQDYGFDQTTDYGRHMRSGGKSGATAASPRTKARIDYDPKVEGEGWQTPKKSLPGVDVEAPRAADYKRSSVPGTADRMERGIGTIIGDERGA